MLAVLPFSSYTQPGAMEWPAKMEEALSLCGSLGRWDVVDAMGIRARHGKGQVWGKGPNAKTYLRPGQVRHPHLIFTSSSPNPHWIQSSPHLITGQVCGRGRAAYRQRGGLH